MKLSRIDVIIFGLIGLILTGLDFIICSLRVITIGAANTALYCPVVKRARRSKEVSIKEIIIFRYETNRYCRDYYDFLSCQ